MHLKSLEIHGFKSFPDKTVLTFENDITAVVGPNGSGKSNISDALRWVMGEQSNKALRGSKMEDVIFSGASGRAASGFAQVTLTLDNESGELPVDSTEVAITRRYYRSGDSEYYINRRSARLKDIHELLMDTGLGRDGYSIIGQGRIDEILSARSSDRREVFEEAAGISRFRSRKEDAQKKLDSAADNLLRINDKISELELQRGPLEKQAEVAKKYLLLRDELRGIEVAVWLDELSKAAQNALKYRENARAAKERVEEATREQAELFAGINSLEERSAALEREAETLRAKATALQVELTALNAAKENNISSKERNLEQINTLKEQMELSLNRRGELEAQVKRNDEQIEQLAKRLEELSAASESLRKELDAANKKAALCSEKMNSILSEKLDITNRKAALEAVLTAAGEQQSQSIERRRALEAELSLARERCSEAENASSSASKALEALRRESEKQANIVKGFALKLKNAEEAYSEANSKLASHSRSHNELESKYRLYSDMEREYEGYSKSVKRVMQDSARGRLKNIHGPVSQLIHVDGPYVTAIETVLGGALQNIVVSTRNDAKSAMELLKRDNAGRATFLPIDAMRGSLLKEDPSREEGFVGIASELTSYDKQYEGIFRYLLGKTVVVENINFAISMARKFSDRFRIVTLDGQVINAGGSMTGGSVARSTGILSRASELEKMAKAMEESESKLEQLKTNASDIELKLKAARSAHEAASIKARELEGDVIRADGELARTQAVAKALSDAAHRLEKDIAEHESAVKSSIEETEHNKAELASLETKLEDVCTKESECAHQRDGSLERAFSIRQSVENSEAESAAVSAKRGACLELGEEYRRLKEDAEGARKLDIERIAQLTLDNEQLAKEALEQGEMAAKLERALSEVNAELARRAAARGENDAQRGRMQSSIQGKTDELLLLERDAGRLAAKCSEADMMESQIIERLWETYGLTRQTASEAAVEVQSIGKARQQIIQIKREIKALGNPNIGAIEEFERVNERYTYYSEQRDDAQNSKRELENLIRGLTVQMREIFAEKFQQINLEFQRTFMEIFGGGSASVELEDEENILESGIEIKVQPPGKKVRSLTLLSGGEKAFTAIALYFAIIRTNPTPFCVLDEIETALDEVNVGRFANYLTKMTQNTQFVVVTHRRPTMELAPKLYGVTMQQRGISKVLPLKLDQVEQELFS